MESMLKTRLDDVDGCLRELEALKGAGCELVRVAFPSEELGANLRALCERTTVALMADIHFNYKFALEAISCGCRSIRINPGNMGSKEGLMEVLSAARSEKAVIRIGSNGGSLGNKQLASAGGDHALALAAAVEEQLIPLAEDGFEDIIISAKSSSIADTVRANALLSPKYPFPMHIGITEAGPGMDGMVKSASGLSLLLGQGIGDTMRVSLTGKSVEEVHVAYAIQRSLGIRARGVNLISCPTCGRRRIDTITLVERVRKILPDNIPDGTTIAVMGCEVNGPKEAAAADIGIAGTQNGFVVFKKGKAVVSAEIEKLEEVMERIFSDHFGV